VRIQVKPTTTFLQLLGWKELATTVDAVARAYSSASDSFWAVGNITIGLDPGFGLEVVGGCRVPTQYQSLCRSVPQIDRDAWLSMLDDIVPLIPPKPACTHTVNQLRVNGGVLGVPNQTRVYCVNGTASLKDVNIRGKVVLIARRGVTFSGSVTAENLEIYVDGNDVVFGAGVEFDADRLRIYATGDMEVDVRGGATVHADDALLYLEDGTLNWAGNSEMKLCAPPKHDPQGFGGLVLFLKNYSANREVIFRGTSDNYPSQIIAHSVRFVGNTYSFIDFDPRFLYQASVIELLK